MSTFSLLLAGKLAVPGEAESEVPKGSAQSGSPGKVNDTEPENSITGRSEVQGNHDHDQGSSSGKPVQDGGTPPIADGEGTLAGSLGSLGLLTGLLQGADPMGITNGTAPHFDMTEGLPADFRARLAGDIAAGFSNRNGIQNLVLKLDSDHLGQVDVRLQAKGDHLSVRLMAADRESEAALRGNIKELSEAIQKRTGRFQHIEVRVDLKDNQETGKEPAEEEGSHSSKRDSQEDNREDSGPRGEPENPNTAEFEPEPDVRVQGG
ncbi:MAG: flagellar hook-length control protein FliK [Candidatus Krumholzibacteria bacterium]|nr:flagellar hook-length control protein FliK [Candidatus Krumholzibacteria bacterium]